MFKTLIAAALLTAAAIGASSTTQAAEGGIQVFNDGAYAITGISIIAAGYKGFSGSNLLVRQLDAGDSVLLVPDEYGEVCTFRIRIRFADGSVQEMERFDTCLSSVIRAAETYAYPL